MYPVGPLTELTFEKLSDYAVKSLPTHYFPGTMFGMVRQSGKVALNFAYVPDSVIGLLMGRLNPIDPATGKSWAYDYLMSYPDGCNFSAGMRTTIFPSNTQYQ